MAKGKKKPVDPLAKAAAGLRAERTSRGKKRGGAPTVQGKKAIDAAIQEYKVQRDANLTTFLKDYWDPETDSFPELERLSKQEIYNPDTDQYDPNPEFDPDTYRDIIGRSGLTEDDLEQWNLSTEKDADISETTGRTRDIGRSLQESTGYDYEPEDIEASDIGGLTGRAVSDVLGAERSSGFSGLGRTTKGLEEGAGSGRGAAPRPSAAPQPSSRRTTAIPRRRLLSLEEVKAKQQGVLDIDLRTGKQLEPYIPPQVVTPANARATDLGLRAISSVEDTPNRRENELRRMIGTFNALTAEENQRLGVERGSSESMTIPVEGGGTSVQQGSSAPEATSAVPPITPPTPGRVIRSSRNINTAGGLIGPPRPVDSTPVPVSEVIGNTENTAPAPVPGRPTGPRRMRINRVATGDPEKDQPNPSGMSPEFTRFLRAPGTGLAGLIGAGSRSGGALLKGADAVTRRVGGQALGPVLGGWDRDPSGNLVDLDRPDTAVRRNPDTGAFELVNPLKTDLDPLDPNYDPVTHIGSHKYSELWSPEEAQKAREYQADLLRKKKIRSLTGRVPQTQGEAGRNPLPGLGVMEEYSGRRFGPDIEALAKEHGVHPLKVAEIIAGMGEYNKELARMLKPDDVVTSGQDIDILRAKPGGRESVKGQMTKVKTVKYVDNPDKPGEKMPVPTGERAFRTSAPTDKELIRMFPPNKPGDLDAGGAMTDAYYNRLNTTYLEVKKSILSPEEMAKRDADQEAAKKAARNAGMPKPPSKAQQARDRKASAKRIAEDEAPRKAYKALREGANAEDQYDTAGFIRAYEALPSSTTGGTSPAPGVPAIPSPFSDGSADVASRILGADIDQWTVDQTGVPAWHSNSGELLKPSSDESHNQRYVFRGHLGKVEGNPTGNPYFVNVNDTQFDKFAGYRSQASVLASPLTPTEPATPEPTAEQRMANIRRADAAVAAKRSGGFAREPLAGESMGDMARRVAGPAGPALRQIGRSMKSQRKAERKGLLSGGQFGQPAVEPSTDVG